MIHIKLILDLTNWLGPTNSFVKSNINFYKEHGIKISIQNTLKYTDMKKEWLLFLTSLKIISYTLGDQL